MRVKLDENLPAGLVGILAQYGHETSTVHQEGLAGYPDAVIWNVAQQETRFLITMDLDFSDVRRYLPGTHGGILILRPSRQGRKAIWALMQALLAQESLDQFAGCLVIADEHKIRVRKA